MDRGLLVEVIVLAATAVLAAGATWWVDRPRVGRGQVEEARERSVAAKQELDTAVALPQLPLVDQSWKRTRALWAACGVEMVVVPGPPAPPPTNGYAGPTYAWHAMLRAPGDRLFWCLEQASVMPVLVNTITVLPTGQAGANIAVLGKTGETRLEVAVKQELTP